MDTAAHAVIHAPRNVRVIERNDHIEAVIVVATLGWVNLMSRWQASAGAEHAGSLPLS